MPGFILLMPGFKLLWLGPYIELMYIWASAYNMKLLVRTVLLHYETTQEVLATDHFHLN